MDALEKAGRASDHITKIGVLAIVILLLALTFYGDSRYAKADAFEKEQVKVVALEAKLTAIEHKLEEMHKAEEAWRAELRCSLTGGTYKLGSCMRAKGMAPARSKKP